MSDVDILRRIAERGLRDAQARHIGAVDIWQHMLDEIARFQPDRLAAELSAARADAERIDWIDAINERFQMSWRIGKAPAGNLSVQSVISLGGKLKPPTLRETIDAARATPSAGSARPCTCHPDDNPPVPCPRRYALSECRLAAAEAARRALDWLHQTDHEDSAGGPQWNRECVKCGHKWEDPVHMMLPCAKCEQV